MTTPPVVALIGAGGIARPHLDGWRALGAHVRIHSHAGAERLAGDDPMAEAVPTLAAALEGADVVDVCTPTDTHPAVVRAALAAGADVLCEKPLARTAAEAQELVTEAAHAGRKLMPGHVVRWFPAYETLHARVAAGDLGDLAVLRFTRTGARPLQPWFQDAERSGGIVLDQMIHDIDQARWLAGEVVEVSAQHSRPGEVATAHLLLTHASGAVSHVAGTWGPPGTTFRTTVEVAGTGGLLQHDSTEHPEVRLDARDAAASTGLLPPIVGVSPYHREIEDFLTWVRGGDQPRLGAADGVEAIRIGEAALQALATGDPVALSTPDPTTANEVPA
ncbi:Gfo/Idh/MocA family protein [Pseudactinotalea suaedae]|uniref:Gfo/Idh/MocA family protein n=1 Tax=Pseudactinotalea suaedae TaxID=1524924 RepID=UPI0012E2A668|nr:Gfo/Idh/MocA family oxidoreductase [Pseudactinotalea suaedae]